MNAQVAPSLASEQALAQAIAQAVDSIAPNWPLDAMIAVSPYWGLIHQPFSSAAEDLTSLAGSPLALPLAAYGDAWRQGEIGADDLHLAAREWPDSPPQQALVAALDDRQPPLVPAPLFCDILDRHRDLHREPAWCDTITHQISQFCAAYFDGEQADWHPARQQGLYAAWRQAIAADRGLTALMGGPDIPGRAGQLAADGQQQIQAALAQLDLPPQEWPDYLRAVLLRINGWATWCAYLRWQARLAGGDDGTLVDLLAIRLSWEALLDDGQRDGGSLWRQWQEEWQNRRNTLDRRALQVRQIWQRAQEIAYQRRLADSLASQTVAPAQQAPAVQAAFCIDVRSEVFRRHLEAQSTDIETLGFAGFFGLPISYAPLGTAARRAQLPGLLAPRLHVTDSTGSAARDGDIRERRGQALASARRWRKFQAAPVSTFTLVEALGLGYLGKLIARSLAGGGAVDNGDRLGLSVGDAGTLRPILTDSAAGGAAARAALAEQVLRGMGLTGRFARLVLLAGHGAQSRNNPQEAGLHCGACCGQTGEVNARVLADLLNDDTVRGQLAARGIAIPDGTWFVAALHNTTTDEVTLFDTDRLPTSHHSDLAALREQLGLAGDGARRERAPGLGLTTLAAQPAKLLKALRRRADDWSQTRPEWGLADNAAFVIAPRARSRGVNLQGRSFLHDYDHRQDPDGSVLAQILGGPLVVTHWINMQYFGSTVDNPRFGSGNKTLHNVACGRIGLFEGNGGDLRIGLAHQSVHDGEHWRHTPLRLTAVIEAPRDLIDRVLASQPTVRQLLDNGWLHLLRLDGGRAELYRQGRWRNFPGH